MLALLLVVAFQSQPRRPISSCSPITLDVNALSPSLIAPILEHPAIPALSIDIRPRSRLKPKHKHLFDRTKRNRNDDDNSTLLFDELALVACSTGVVCRKELLETYAAATFIHAKFPHVKRFADLAAGHGLLSWFLLALDDHHNNDNNVKNTDNCINRRPRTVVCVDRRMPPSADAIAAAMIKRFPELERRWSYVQADLSAVVSHPSCVLTSVHACGTLSDYLIEIAIGDTNTSATTGTNCMSNSAPLAIVPCCHTVQERKGYRPHLLSGMDAGEVATLVEERKNRQENLKHEAVGDVVDEVRCRTLRNAGYDVEEVMLPEAFTARNRLLLATINDERPPTKSKGGTSYADAKREVGVNTFFQRQSPSPPIRIPLGDDPESIAHCHAISGRERAMTRLQQQIPNHFSPSLVMSIWLTKNTSADMEVGGKGSSFDGSSVLTVETLQAFANQCCKEIEIEAEEDDNQMPQIRVQCKVEVFGEVNVQSTSGRCSQRYRFTYSKPEGSVVNLSIAGISRTIAKRIDGTIRERVVDTFGDILR